MPNQPGKLTAPTVAVPATCDGATHVIFTKNLARRMLRVQAPSNNAASIFVDDTGRGATQDSNSIEIQPGDALVMTADTFVSNAPISIIGTSGDIYYAAQA